MNGRPWTDEELRRLEEMAQAGASRAQIARALGRHEQSVKPRLARLRREVSDVRGPADRWEDDIKAAAQALGARINAALARQARR